MLRALRMAAEWEKREPEERHWHLGPLAVEPGLQGMGIGSEMVERFCAKMDAAGDTAYLETDRRENVRLFERFGFEALEEAPVLGVPNWFMLRRARTVHGSSAS